VPTALQLVNRVLRKSRDEAVTELTSQQALTVLDLLNEGKNWALGSFAWDFDRRTTGVIQTLPKIEGTDAGTTNGGNQMTIPGVALTDIAGGHVARIVITDDENYGSTAFRITSVATVGADSVIQLATQYPGATDMAADYTIFANEYLLPSTVRRITAVQYQEDEVVLREMPRELGLDSIAVRPNDDISDATEFVTIGSRLRATYDRDTVADGDEDAGMGLQFYPTPSSQLVFHYDWVYEHPDISSTQELEDVNPNVVDLIVEYAYAGTLMSGFNADPEHGRQVLQVLQARAAQIYSGHTPDPMRRVELRPVFERSAHHRGSVQFGRIPKNATGI
jgi:hypothetical protein